MPAKHPDLKAVFIFTENVLELLHRRHLTQRELANWCHKSEVWISKILKRERQARMDDLDKIADFFGLATYQLFQPGISAHVERRSGRDRRNGQDRRISQAHRVMLKVKDELERVRPHGRFPRRTRKEVG